MWCLAHRLELAVKNTAFDHIDNMLLKVYYVYEKSPQKCRQLEYINVLKDRLALVRELIKLVVLVGVHINRMQ